MEKQHQTQVRSQKWQGQMAIYNKVISQTLATLDRAQEGTTGIHFTIVSDLQVLCWIKKLVLM